VRLGPEAGAPRVTVLLYADDIVLLAETPQDLQAGLDAIAAWACRWRFTFSAGPEKSAVMVVNGPRLLPPLFMIGSVSLPFVDQYPYLGVLFHNRGGWGQHADRSSARGNARFAECVAWAMRETLDVAFGSKLFHVYVLAAVLHGSELAIIDRQSLRTYEKCLRGWGRRLLGWPRGSPNAAVLGDLGWDDFEALALGRVAGLFARLRCRPWAGVRSEIPAVVYQYALTRNDSWASWAAASLGAAGVPDHNAWGVGPGAPTAAGQRWRRRAAVSALSVSSQQRFTAASAEIDSLAFYASLQPAPLLHLSVHNRRAQAADAREWGLARCGHHSFCDGRIARHQTYHSQCLLCDCDDGALEHALNRCPATEDVRSTWRRRVGAGSGYSDGSAAMAWMFDPGSLRNSGPTCAAHVALVSAVSRCGALAFRELRALNA
jgi:hypothetical protein